MPYIDPQPYKDAARMAVKYALRRGEIFKPKKCENCRQEPKILHAHHNDHELPLEVNWLCPKCHSEVHHKYGGIFYSVISLASTSQIARNLLNE